MPDLHTQWPEQAGFNRQAHASKMLSIVLQTGLGRDRKIKP